MRLSSTIVSLLSVAAATLAAPIERSTLATTPTLPFNFTYLFSATLQIGTPSNYIAVEGGTLINEPIVSGTIVGPAVNGTIQGGFAHPSIYNTTLQVPVIDLYGVTSDNSSFYIHETGTGTPAEQVTRIVRTLLPPAEPTLVADLRNFRSFPSVRPNTATLPMAISLPASTQPRIAARSLWKVTWCRTLVC
jgi:Protein of unknown function (DUF3237)